MAKVSPFQGDFSTGEVSPLFQGRVESPRYKNALATCLNFYPVTQGGLVKRSGTAYVAETKTSSKVSRLVRFEFSSTQAYVIEFGDLYCRFYTNQGQVQSGGSPYEIVSAYSAAELFDLRFLQVADVLYVVHPNHAPIKLIRVGATNWQFTAIFPLDGPYLPIITSGATITPSATSGSVSLAASVSSFTAADWVGTNVLIRIKDGATWRWFQTLFVDTTHLSIFVPSATPLSSTSAITVWRMGVWKAGNFPGHVCFHEDRIVYGGYPSYPQRLDTSNTSDYENFAPSAADGTVVDSNAISLSINSPELDTSRWATSDEKGLIVGNAGAEFIVRGATTTEALTPTNLSAKTSTVYGSAAVAPVQSGKATIHVSRNARKLREFTYYFEVDGFQSMNLNELADHITQSGVKEIAIQREPFPFIWCVRNDGVLATCTYQRESDALKVGWHRHILGGVSDAAGTHAIVESVACIPTPDGFSNDVWVIVNRYINGQTKRYVEYISKNFDDSVAQQDAFFVDSGATFDSPLTVSGATQANPVVLTSTAHGLSNGQTVLVSAIGGMTDLNGNIYTVAGVTTNTFQLNNSDGTMVDGTAFGAYVSGGQARKRVTTISGLTWLEGQTVDVLADGAPQSSKVVSSGAITLDNPAAVVHVGLHYNADIQMLRLDAGAADGTAMGKTRRTHRVGFLVYRTLGLKFGTDFVNLDEVPFNRVSDPMSHAPALFSGIVSETINANYDFENQICARSDTPTPAMILGIAPQLMTQDR